MSYLTATLEGVRGYIRERKGRHQYFELVVYNGRDPSTGRSRYVSRGFNGASYRTPASARKAAEAKLAELIVEVTNERHKATEGTLGHLLDEWLKLAERRTEETTIKGYRAIVKAVKTTPLAAVELRRLTPKMLDDYYGTLLRRRAVQTVRNYHNVVHGALELAVAWEWLPRNPADKVDKLRSGQRNVTAVSVEQLRAIEDKAAASRNATLAVLIRVAAATGARRGEICGLRWGDFDPAAKTLLIEQAIAHGTRGIVTKGTKTHAARRVDLGARTVKRLLEHKTRAEEKNGGPLPASAFIFSNEVDSSKPMKPNSITQAFGRFCEQAGIGGVRFHDIRHNFATSQLAEGTDVGTVADMLGHKNAATTLNIYRHFVPAAGKKAAALMDEILG